MATLLTKNTKPKANYQQWMAGDITNGDILGIYESLGRSAHTVTIESIGGITTIRLNVTKKIFREHNALSESWVGVGQGLARSSAWLEREVELETPLITIEANSIHMWSANEIAISDIKIVSKSPGLKITVT